MNLGDLFISPFITVLVLLFKVLEFLPGQAPGLRTVLAITLFAILIRLVASPFIARRRQSIRKNQEIQPQLEELKRTYAKDPQKLAQAQQQLYRETGVNPLSGCFALPVQLLALFALYSAIVTFLGNSPVQILNIHGRLLIPSLQGEIPPPSQFLWLDLTRPHFSVAILVAITTFLELRLATLFSGGKGPAASTDWLRIYSTTLILGLIALFVPAGFGVFIIVFNLTGIVLYVATQSTSLRRLLAGPAKARRWQIGKALKQDVIQAEQFERLISSLLGPPELMPEDVTLFYELLQFGSHSFSKTGEAALAKQAGRGLSQLCLIQAVPYDLVALHSEFAENCFNSGNSDLAVDLAASGYSCPHGEPGSRTACIMLLAKNECIDKRSKDIYRAFVVDPSTNPEDVRNFARIFQKRGTIRANSSTATVKRRLPLNNCAASLLPPAPYHWVKRNLGLGNLILNQIDLAVQYFREVLSIDPADPTAAQCLAIVLFRKEQYQASLQIVHDARQAGLTEPGLDAVEAACQVGHWLAAANGETPVGIEQIEVWHTQLQGSFPLRRFASPDLDFAQGRLASMLGDLAAARQHLQAAYEADTRSPRFAYHYAKLLQIVGEWETARQVLATRRDDSHALMCLRLTQTSRDDGLQQVDPRLLQYTNNLAAADPRERLASARHALLAGQAADIPPWSPQLVFETAEEADEWADIWLSALIGREASDEARQEMSSERFLRLPKSVQLFFVASAKWLSGDLAGTEENLRKALEMAPNYGHALRLSAAILEAQGKVHQAQPRLERLQRVLPNDHRSRLRGALARWNLGDRTEAITQLERLAGYSEIAPLANFWRGRLLLIQAGEPPAREDLALANALLSAAAEADIPQAPWYDWLCQVKMQYNPDTGWSQRKARQLLKGLPGALSEIPIAEVAGAAALIAVETNHPADMLAGCALQLDLLRNQRDQEGQALASWDNLTEALWRTASTVTSAEDRLALWKLAHEVERSSAKQGRTVRHIADATFMGAMLALTQDGENIDEALAQIDEAIALAPDALIPRLARTSILVNKGDMTAQEAIDHLDKENRQDIARAMEECIWSGADSLLAASYPAGMAAFLARNRKALDSLPVTLEALSDEPIRSGDQTKLLEMARCLAVAEVQDEAIDLYVRVYEAKRSRGLAEELSDYLCYVAVQSLPTNRDRNSDNLKKTQGLLSLAQKYCREDIEGV